MTVPSTWPWELVHFRPHLTSRYIIRRVRRTISRENSRKIHSWKSGYSTCLKSWWKFAKNLRIFEIFKNFKNFDQLYFRYVCQNNDFHYKASKIRLDVNYKLTNSVFRFRNYRLNFLNFQKFSHLIWPGLALENFRKFLKFRAYPGYDLDMNFRWTKSNTIPRNLSVHW